MVCVYIFLIKGNEGRGDDSKKNSKRRERQRERERMKISPGPTAIKPGGRNGFLDDRRANQTRKVLSFPQQEVRIED